MAQPEKRENSVLFSLRELRQIEEDRVTEEDTAQRKQEEERLRAQMEAERKARDEEEAKRRAVEDEERRRRTELEQRAHEAHVRTQEAEARARAEHQAALEQQRMHAELEIRRQEVGNKRPTWLIGVAAVLVVALGGVGYWMYSNHQDQKAKDAAVASERAELEKHARIAKEESDQLKRDLEELSTEISGLNARLLAATTDAEREQVKKEIQAAERRQEELRNKNKGGGRRGGDKGGEKKGPGGINVSDDCANNPLC